jgi:Fe-S-cluster containining protein
MFEFYRSIKSDDTSVLNAFKKLKNIYKSIPDTKGCLKNISKKKGCGAYCCAFQSPQLLYIEFLYIWQFIKNQNDNSYLCDLIERSMLNVVKGRMTKGCIFFNKDNNQCEIHNIRPYSCRVYGITPKEEFQPRYEKMKEIYKGVPGAIVKDQCNLIKTSNGEKVTIFNTNRWWKDIVRLEEMIGIDEDLINDKQGGSYRMSHDHLLISTMPENVLSALAGISLYDNADDKIITVSGLMVQLRKHFEDYDGKKRKNAKN